MEKPPWGPATVKHIADEVRRHRNARGMSTQQLADACAALGWPIKRTVLSNLESGYRETITVPELMVLARALEVPAIQLLYPLGSESEVEILPGRTVSTEAAMLWFTGWYDPFRDEARTLIGHGPDVPAGDLHDWYETGYEDAGAPVHMYAEHRQFVERYEAAETEAARRLPRDRTDDAYRAEVAMLRKETEDLIRAKRQEMRRRGVAVLPDLPPGLEHLR